VIYWACLIKIFILLENKKNILLPAGEYMGEVWGYSSSSWKSGDARESEKVEVINLTGEAHSFAKHRLFQI